MAELAAIARPYAVAAFESANAEGQLSSWSDALALLASYAQMPVLASLLKNYYGEADVLGEIFLSLMSGNLSESQANFVKVLARHRRLQVLPCIAQAFVAECAKVNQVVNARVISASPLSDKQIEKIKQSIKVRFNKTPELLLEVDESILGGLVVRVGDKVIDNSVRGRIRRFKEKLMIGELCN